MLFGKLEFGGLGLSILLCTVTSICSLLELDYAGISRLKTRIYNAHSQLFQACATPLDTRCDRDDDENS